MNIFEKDPVVVGGIIGAIIWLIAMFGIVGQSDYEDAVAQQSLYCEMVAQWNGDAKRGIAPKDRAGWPPFEGEHQCQK